VQLLDENGTPYGVKQIGNKPIVTIGDENGNAITKQEGTITKLPVLDNNSESLLTDILKELKKMNIQLSLMTDEIIENAEIE